MNTNKKVGNEFETEFCRWLFQRGCWAHNFANRSYGQPADIIAIRGGKAFLIDCKVCENNYFDTRRVEDNQKDSMDFWQEVVDGSTALFAIKFMQSGSIYILPYYKVEGDDHRLNEFQVKNLSLSLEEFEEWILE